MTDPERHANPEFNHISDLLLFIVAQDKELEAESHHKLYTEQDTNGYREAIWARGRLLVELPSTLISYQEKGGVVPDEVHRFADFCSGEASDFLERGNTFGIATLLISKGSRTGDPNDLERLAAYLQAPADTDS